MVGGGGGGGGGSGGAKPAWMEGLMAETFFGGCGVHQHRRKNEKNIFCLLCCQSFCPHCLPSHQSHPFLQVRRYVYQDVIRLNDLEKLIDCSYIQPYTINSAKVIFLNQRAQSRSCKGSCNSCFTCDRILQDPFSFCSLSCKVDFMVYHEQDLSSILIFKFEESDLGFSQLEELRMDGLDSPDDDDDDDNNDGRQYNPYSSLEDPSEYNNTTTSCSNSAIGGISRDSETKRNRKGSGFLPGFMVSLNNNNNNNNNNRRKGAPSRSPLS